MPLRRTPYTSHHLIDSYQIHLELSRDHHLWIVFFDPDLQSLNFLLLEEYQNLRILEKLYWP